MDTLYMWTAVFWLISENSRVKSWSGSDGGGGRVCRRLSHIGRGVEHGDWIDYENGAQRDGGAS